MDETHTWSGWNRYDVAVLTKPGLIERLDASIVDRVGYETVYLTHGVRAAVDLLERALARAVVDLENVFASTSDDHVSLVVIVACIVIVVVVDTRRVDTRRRFGGGGQLMIPREYYDGFVVVVVVTTRPGGGLTPLGYETRRRRHLHLFVLEFLELAHDSVVVEHGLHVELAQHRPRRRLLLLPRLIRLHVVAEFLLDLRHSFYCALRYLFLI